jgi:hypothetical protein
MGKGHTADRGFPEYLRDYLNRVTGISTAFFGLSWQPPALERDTLRKLVVDLADRRVLYHHGCGMPRRNMIESCERMRRSVTDALRALPEDSKAIPYVEDMRAACHQFQTYVERFFDKSGHGSPEESFYMALGELRGSVGKALAEICHNYRISSEVLERIENPPRRDES